MTHSPIAVKEYDPQKANKIPKYQVEIIWFNVFFLLSLHVLTLYAVYLCFTSACWKTALFGWIYAHIGAIGVTAGVHRLWSHRSYKAKFPLRVLLCCLFTVSGESDIYTWSRDHRVHHKFSETDADPYSIQRGFFFAHIGWLMCKKHPDVIEKGKAVPVDDLLTDPVVRFHSRFYPPMAIFFTLILPTVISVWFLGETWWNSFFIAGVMKHCYIQNMSFLVNSFAHVYGNQPYDKSMEARENPIVNFLTNGEACHNYHHAFPQDYAASELGCMFHFTTLFIDIMALIGQAYDLKRTNPKSVKNRKLRTGDGTRMKQAG